MMQAMALWFCVTFMVVYLLHILWWTSVRHLRKSGRLTPTEDIVGAPKRAERLIASALERRDIAVAPAYLTTGAAGRRTRSAACPCSAISTIWSATGSCLTSIAW